VQEFAQEAHFLQQTLEGAGSSSSSSSAQLLEAGEAAAAATAGGTSSNAADGSSSSSSSTVDAADALAVEVVLLGVVSSYRRQGVASRLLQQVKRRAMSQG
jgi:ribosomal protein S18 acetylase RimI-like enzyme